MKIRWLSILAVVVMGAASLSGCGKSEAPKSDVQVVTFWQPWGGPMEAALKDMVAEFERTHPKIKIKMSFAANNLTSSQKLFLAIAGGVAPDVTFVDGQQLAEWAARGALTDITDLVKQHGISGDDFWTPRWQESNFDGRTYALPWGADPNFALIWNKDAFVDAGLDPEKPPRTIEEMDAYNVKLMKHDAKGRLVRFGLMPWARWGNDNMIFTWGYIFGGDFFQMPPPGQLVGKVTVDDPKVVEALTWMSSYAKKYDVQTLNSFRTSFVGQANDPLYSGAEAMTLLHVAQLRDLKKFAPLLKYGLAPIPAPPGGEYPSSWIGGWSLASPRGAKVSDAAFEFMLWMCTSKEGTMVMGSDRMYQFPAYKKGPYYDSIKNDRDRMVFYDILKNAKHVRTLMPVQGFLMNELRQAVDHVLYRGADPKAELSQVRVEAQARLENVMERVARRKELEGKPAAVAKGDGHE